MRQVIDNGVNRVIDVNFDNLPKNNVYIGMWNTKIIPGKLKGIIIVGVMRCNRTDCESVMCTRYSTAYGYLCDACFNELVHQGPATNITEFLMSSPNHQMREAVEAYFEAIFPQSKEEF